MRVACWRSPAARQLEPASPGARSFGSPHLLLTDRRGNAERVLELQQQRRSVDVAFGVRLDQQFGTLPPGAGGVSLLPRRRGGLRHLSLKPRATTTTAKPWARASPSLGLPLGSTCSDRSRRDAALRSATRTRKRAVTSAAARRQRAFRSAFSAHYRRRGRVQIRAAMRRRVLAHHVPVAAAAPRAPRASRPRPAARRGPCLRHSRRAPRRHRRPGELAPRQRRLSTSCASGSGCGRCCHSA